jgi:hypothetical protein
MINFTLDSVDAAPYLTEYDINIAPEFGTAFTKWDGTEIQQPRSRRTTITVKLENVPNDTAEDIAALAAGDAVSVTYTTPLATTADFRTTSYHADCEDPGFNESGTVMWNIAMTLESSEAAAPEDGL